jgi:hydrogenase expression/formation protein HypD
MKYLDEFRDPHVAAKLISKIHQLYLKINKPITLMEVCGTHTVSISKAGIRKLLPEGVRLASGPGCPVCVTVQSYLDTAIEIALKYGAIITTFGDMIRVPGSKTTLAKIRAEGIPVEVVYSPLDALKITQSDPSKPVMFLAVGFETTAPTIAATVLEAKSLELKNFYILSACKTMPSPMRVLAQDPRIKIDGFICPPHVSAIIGSNAYNFIADEFKIPCIVAGFESLDVLYAVYGLLELIADDQPQVVNQYSRIVKPNGNEKAKQVLGLIFESTDADWRGIGIIPASGLKLKMEYREFDAFQQFPVTINDSFEPKGCQCGNILKSILTPPECPLFSKTCTIDNPIGACMVSSEGACAAYYKYRDTEEK